jgi:hypothetical protein
MWKYIGTSQVGTSHLKSGQPCQDNLAYVIAGKYFIAGISDGAGSAPYSQTGSEEACCTALTKLSFQLDSDNSDLETAFASAAISAREQIARIANQDGHDARDYACTLLLFGIGPDGAAALQIGDGLIVFRLEGSEEWHFAIWPQRGEYANTTFFLTDSTYEEHVQVVSLPKEIVEVGLISDGLEALALNYLERKVHIPFWEGLFKPVRASEQVAEMTNLLEPLENFLASDRVVSRTDDDLSIILAAKIDCADKG